jgi:KaiC/GvpD/RAD55 family RecA-like ATPase
MKHNGHQRISAATQLPKCPTGIQGLDEITGGGLPRGRPTLICGGAGCGKTLLATEFLVRGAVQFDEPGVLMAFEETEKELTANVASLGFDLAGFGLLGMRERASYVGGVVKVKSARHAGTEIEIRIPLPPKVASTN